MDQPLVWMNGALVEYDSAKISIEDRGFQFSDGIYEVVRAVEGRYFAFQPHLDRMRLSLKSVEIEVSMSDSDFRSVADTLLAQSHEREVTLYIQITRGTAPRSHVIPRNTTPTLIMILRPFHRMDETVYTNGVKVITVEDQRWLRCDVKTTGLLANGLARERARRANADDAIFVRDGWVTEGTSTNVFMVQNGEVITPMADHRILRGITRDVVLSLARERALKTMEREIGLGEFKQAGEAFFTSTTMEVLPVVEIDQTPVGSGKVGLVTRLLRESYQNVLRGVTGGR